MPTRRHDYGVAAPEPFRRRLSQVAVAVQNQDNREHDIFDSDDYFQFHGGMIATIRALTGENPAALLRRHANPANVRGSATWPTRPAGSSARGWSTPSGSPR